MNDQSIIAPRMRSAAAWGGTLLLLLTWLPGIGHAQPGGTPYTPDNQLDLNRAPLEEVMALPISEALAEAIVDYRTFVAYFNSIFDLMKVEGMTADVLRDIRPLIYVEPVFQIEVEELGDQERRVRERFYLVQRLLADEGASEAFVDEYVDQIKDPRNVNELSFYELISLQNVSPIDAVAVLKEKEVAGKIENQRQLRSSSGISYYGFRNLRDFVRYDDAEDEIRIRGDYQFRIYNTPYTLDDADNLTEPIVGDDSRDFDLNSYAGRLSLDTARPFLTNKLRLKYGRHLKGAVLTHRNLAEDSWDETAKFYLEARDLPGVDTPLGKLRLHSAVAGNFAVTTGEGLVMDATDFFRTRITGLGFSVRSIGLRGDLSRSDEYTMKGGALDASLGKVRGLVYYSRDDKDAILNPDGSFNSYFRMVPRISNELMAEIRSDVADGTLSGADTAAFLPMRDVMDEQVVGANLKYEFQPGTYLGVSGVEMRYENNVFDNDVANRWNPDPGSLLLDLGRLEDKDSEIGAGYNSVALGNYRRVWGLEGQTVFKNLSLNGEYAKLETSDASGAVDRVFSQGPEAFIAKAYLQYENFNFLALYRDYDIGFDNPYNRAFSEDTRFEQTILDGNPFRLKNPYWASMGNQGGNPTPKAERGFYFFTRYQISRQLTITGFEYDFWKRKADNADLRRMVLRAEYRPVFPVRIRMRHRVSSRDENRPEDIRRFNSWETRMEFRLNLSHFDQVRFMYSSSQVKFAGRGRLNGPAGGGDQSDDPTSVVGIPGRTLQAMFTHNFNDFLTGTVSTQVYDGFIWNFEDNEFVVLDGQGFRNWFMLRSRLSENLTWRFKWTLDHQLPRTYVDIRSFGSLSGLEPEASNAGGDRSSFRFQLDLSF